MDYKKLYKDTITKLQEMVNSGEITIETACGICADFIPESEDEKTKKEIINYFKCQSREEPSRKDTHNKWIGYIEKHALSKDDYDFLRDCARVLKTLGWQSYADRLTGLCPALGEEAKAMMSTPIIFDESDDERIRKDIIAYIETANQILPQFQKDKWIAWLEKQGAQKPAWSEEVEEPVSGELEKAVNAYISNENNYSHSRSDTFKAGAEWHEQQMKEALRTEYEKGRHDALEEMKKSK